MQHHPAASARSPAAARPTPLDSWLQRQAAREQRLVTLEDALLGNRAAAYGLYRLRFFALRCLSSAGLHVVRLTLLRFIFSHQNFLTTLLLNAAAGLLTSFWWGALEVLRGRVRHLARDGEGRRIPGEIAQWLAVAAILAGSSLLLPAVWIAWELLRHGRSLDVLHLYVFAIGFRLAADLLTLTLHSGAYAVRRVYRPLPAMIAVELGSFAIVLAAWPWLGRWSFPISVVAGTVMGSTLTVHYTARVYRLLGWLPLRLAVPGLTRFAHRSIGSDLFAAGTSYALMKMDAFLMLAMFHSRIDPAHEVSLFLLFVSIGPAVQAGFDWAQLLYFDLKRLQAPCLGALRRRYEQLALRLAVVVAVVLWGIGCLLGTAVMQRNLGELYWLIGPFFLSRSLLALAQVQAFAKRQYGTLLANGAVLLAALLALQVGFSDAHYRLLGLAATAFLLAWWLRVVPKMSREGDAEPRVLALTEWLQHLRDVREPVRVRSIRFFTAGSAHLRQAGGVRAWEIENRWRHRRMARRIGRRLGAAGRVSVIYPGRVTWFETARAAPSLNAKTLLGWGGGLVHAVADTGVEPHGIAALEAAGTTGMLGAVAGPARVSASVARLWDPPPGERVDSVPHSAGQEAHSGRIAAVRAAFAKTVPRGVIHAVGEPLPPLLRSASQRDRRAIFFEAVYFARHLQRSRRRCRFDVTSLCVDDELHLAFIIDRRCPRHQRRRWRRIISQMNLASTLRRGSLLTATILPSSDATPRTSGSAWRGHDAQPSTGLS